MRTLVPKIRKMADTRKNLDERPIALIMRKGRKERPAAPEAMVATLNGIGVKAAAARNHMPH